MQGFAWASNYLDWYVYLPGICTLRAMAPTMPNLAPSGPRTAPTPAFVSIVTTFGPLAAPCGPLFVTRKTQ